MKQIFIFKMNTEGRRVFSRTLFGVFNPAPEQDIEELLSRLETVFEDAYLEVVDIPDSPNVNKLK